MKVSQRLWYALFTGGLH